jgi:hypothetical protein
VVWVQLRKVERKASGTEQEQRRDEILGAKEPTIAGVMQVTEW